MAESRGAVMLLDVRVDGTGRDDGAVQEAFARAKSLLEWQDPSRVWTPATGLGVTGSITHTRDYCAAAVARTFPRTPIVLNHTGFPWDRSEEGLAAWRHGMEVLAREPNVCIKISEFGLKDRAWDYDDNRRVVLDALAIFGVERAMFATNFPVAGLRIGYRALVTAMHRMLADLPPGQRERFFWKNAKSFYRL